MSPSQRKVLFIDESGDHSLDVIDPQYPVFVLGGVIMDLDYAQHQLEEKISAFKIDIFGGNEIILHSADITRNRNGFEKMKDPSFRNQFYSSMNALMLSLEYQVVACAIRKDEHALRYGLGAIDPYMLALHVLVERFCFEIGSHGRSGIIVAEKRNPTLDHELELAWLSLKIRGTDFIPAKAIEQRIEGLHTREKSKNIAGLQLADLVVSPIGRHVIGKTDKDDWRIIEQKFRRSRSGAITGYGLVELPRKE